MPLGALWLLLASVVAAADRAKIQQSREQGLDKGSISIDKYK